MDTEKYVNKYKKDFGITIMNIDGDVLLSKKELRHLLENYHKERLEEASGVNSSSFKAFGTTRGYKSLETSQNALKLISDYVEEQKAGAVKLATAKRHIKKRLGAFLNIL